MRYILTYIFFLSILILGCKNELTPDVENLSSILKSKKYKITIKNCAGGITGKIHCRDDKMTIDGDIIVFTFNKEKHERILSEAKIDSLNHILNQLAGLGVAGLLLILVGRKSKQKMTSIQLLFYCPSVVYESKLSTLLLPIK